ncbi:MAG: patatin-like phospholipase family protein [Bacteriovoracaceae bacterium]|jgi:predicted acylesterase/phospholipase RssA|nr:patatin-like phospholipase family protein [Bacteriovoracaceae bacterium]
MTTLDLNELKNKKTALVLSGGVVKAASWHLGVALALEDLGFTFKSNQNSSDEAFKLNRPLEIDTYVGSSAGAAVCVFLACGYSPQEVINATLGLSQSRLKKLSYKHMFHFAHNIFRNKNTSKFHLLEDYPKAIQKILKPFMTFPGFFSTEGVKKYLLENVLDADKFEDFIPDLFIVGTQLDHSRKVIFSKYNYPNPTHDNTAVYYKGISVSDAAAASMSVPPFYAPYPILNPYTNETDYYIDGEIRETLSTHVAEDNNCEVIISSWTHTPLHYQEEVGSLVNHGIPQIAIQSIYLLIQKKIVASRAKRATAIDIMDSVHTYMKENKFEQTHIRNIMSLLEQKLAIKKNVRLIDIAPDHDDYKLFFGNSFSLNPKTTEHTVKAGYKKTMQVLGQSID